MFWKTKSEKEIEANARAKERATCEEHFLNELSIQRKRFQCKLNDREKELSSEHEKREKDIETKFGIEISRLFNRIAVLEDENRRYLEAVSRVAPYAYKLESIAQSLAVESQEIAVEKARKMANINNVKHELESTMRKIEKLSPKLNKLMNIDSEYPEVIQ
jgi:hypothetical protein